MTPVDCRSISMLFADRSTIEFDHGGNTMIAAELLWGAVAHALLAIAEINRWECHGHQGYFQVARRLAAEQPTIPWRSDISAADQLHQHFYNRDLGPGELRSRRAAAERALRNALPLIPYP